MKILNQAIKDLTNIYYLPRSKKIFNLIDLIAGSKKTKFTLGGCIIEREKNHIILTKEKRK